MRTIKSKDMISRFRKPVGLIETPHLKTGAGIKKVVLKLAVKEKNDEIVFPEYSCTNVRGKGWSVTYKVYDYKLRKTFEKTFKYFTSDDLFDFLRDKKNDKSVLLSRVYIGSYEVDAKLNRNTPQKRGVGRRIR